MELPDNCRSPADSSCQTGQRWPSTAGAFLATARGRFFVVRKPNADFEATDMNYLIVFLGAGIGGAGEIAAPPGFAQGVGGAVLP